LGLNYWLDNDFQCPNWWYPEIGVPQVLAPVMILIEVELAPDQFEKGIKILNRSAIGMTGQNKVWQSGNVLLRNLLLKNEDTIRLAATSIQEELVVSTGEGVQLGGPCAGLPRWRHAGGAQRWRERHRLRRDDHLRSVPEWRTMLGPH
jgi:hypothetical protein